MRKKTYRKALWLSCLVKQHGLSWQWKRPVEFVESVWYSVPVQVYNGPGTLEVYRNGRTIAEATGTEEDIIAKVLRKIRDLYL